VLQAVRWILVLGKIDIILGDTLLIWMHKALCWLVIKSCYRAKRGFLVATVWRVLYGIEFLCPHSIYQW